MKCSRAMSPFAKPRSKTCKWTIRPIFSGNKMPHIFLYGPPGTGKSTVGKILARNLKLPFIDLDRVIEKNAGMPISQIMEGQGEPAFRNLESMAVQNVIAEKESVIALGGGALLREENRTIAENNGKIVLLMA